MRCWIHGKPKEKHGWVLMRYWVAEPREGVAYFDDGSWWFVDQWTRTRVRRDEWASVQYVPVEFPS